MPPPPSDYRPNLPPQKSFDESHRSASEPSPAIIGQLKGRVGEIKKGHEGFALRLKEVMANGHMTSLCLDDEGTQGALELRKLG